MHILNNGKIMSSSLQLYNGLPGWIPVSEKLYLQNLEKHASYFEGLKRICVEIGEPVEGNLFHPHHNINVSLEETLPKQVNIYSLARTANRVLEIGFNAGHSVLLMLIANNTSEIICFDICSHAYTEKCFEYLAKHFPNRLQLIKGDSTQTVPQYILDHPSDTFDLVHIDGGHHPEIVQKDFNNCYTIATKFIVMDDTNMSPINGIVEKAILKKLVLEIHMCKTIRYQHRILKKL